MRGVLITLLLAAALVASSCTENGTPTPSPSATRISTLSPFPSYGVLPVPKVVGLKVAAAERALTDAGLALNLYVTTGTYLHGVVVKQAPAPRSLVEPGTTVRIVVAPSAAG